MQPLLLKGVVLTILSEDLIDCKPNPMIWRQCPGFGIRCLPLDCQIYKLHKNGTSLLFTTSVHTQEKDWHRNMAQKLWRNIPQKLLIVMLIVHVVT